MFYPDGFGVQNGNKPVINLTQPVVEGRTVSYNHGATFELVEVQPESIGLRPKGQGPAVAPAKPTMTFEETLEQRVRGRSGIRTPRIRK